MTTKTKTLIYALIDPISNLVRYIGKSSSGLDRAKAHCRPSILDTDKTYCGRWIRKLKAANVTPIIAVVEYCAADSLSQRERWWIAFARAWGCPLTNLTDGGEGTPGREVRQESRLKVSISNKKTYARPELRERHRAITKKAFQQVEIRTRHRVSTTDAMRRSDVRHRHISRIQDFWTAYRNLPADQKRILKTRCEAPGVRGDVLRVWRKTLNMTCEEAARLLGIAQSSLSRIEHNRIKPAQERYVRHADLQGPVLKMWRKSIKLTRREAARLLSVSNSTLKRIENEKDY